MKKKRTKNKVGFITLHGVVNYLLTQFGDITCRITKIWERTNVNQVA